jgi:hypothetical protein
MKITKLVPPVLLVFLVLAAGCAYQFGATDVQDLSIVRVAASGAEMWRHTIDSGFGGAYEMILSVAPTPEGGVFVSHYYTSPPSSHRDKIYWTTCIGADGSVVWDKDLSFASMTPTPDGGFIGVTKFGFKVVRIGPDGSPVWTINQTTVADTLPKARKDSYNTPQFNAVVPVGPDRYVIAGGLWVPSWGFRATIDGSGEVLETKKFIRLSIGNLAPMPDGGWVVVGGTQMSRLRASDTVRWTRTFWQAPDDLPENVTIRGPWIRGFQVEDGEIRVLSVILVSRVDEATAKIHAVDEAIAVTYDDNGTVLGEVHMEVPRGCPITLAADGGYAFAALESDEPGKYVSLSSEGSDVHIVKMDADGNLEWDRTVRGPVIRIETISAVEDGGYILGTDIRR